MTKKTEKLVEKVAECIFLNHKMQFHVTPQLRCFSAADNRRKWTEDYKRLSPKDQKRWKVIAKAALVQALSVLDKKVKSMIESDNRKEARMT